MAKSQLALFIDEIKADDALDAQGFGCGEGHQEGE